MPPPPAPDHTELIATLCRQLAEADPPPSLATLAQQAGLSPWHLQRVFKAHTGLSPKAYVQALRAERARTALAPHTGEADVTQAIWAAGYPSASRFYAEAPHALGMLPNQYRQGGQGTCIQFAVAQCSLGSVLVAATQVGLCAVLLGDEAEALVHDLQDRFPRAELVGGDAPFEQLVAKVLGLIEAPQTGWHLPLDVRGTAFQQRVWQALRGIPVGATTTYTELAERIGSPKAVRAVAGACAANPLAVLVPCHRVIRQDGHLSGYRWGIDRKRALLLKEQAQATAIARARP